LEVIAVAKCSQMINGGYTMAINTNAGYTVSPNPADVPFEVAAMDGALSKALWGEGKVCMPIPSKREGREQEFLIDLTSTEITKSVQAKLLVCCDSAISGIASGRVSVNFFVNFTAELWDLALKNDTNDMVAPPVTIEVDGGNMAATGVINFTLDGSGVTIPGPLSPPGGQEGPTYIVDPPLPQAWLGSDESSEPIRYVRFYNQSGTTLLFAFANADYAASSTPLVTGSYNTVTNCLIGNGVDAPFLGPITFYPLV
jgi:hypothetical protein